MKFKKKKASPGAGKGQQGIAPCYLSLAVALPCVVFSRWEEEKKDDGVKWYFLEHKGPVFAPPYEPMPKDVKFYYDGE